MTGANRLLIGVGWSMVVLLAWWRYRSLSRRRANRPSGSPARLREMEGQTGSGITLDRGHTIEVAFSQQPPSTR